MLKKFISILLILLITSLSCVSAIAASSIQYNNTLNYIFNPDKKEDLFDSFKNIMPGDKKTQTIVLQNTEKNKIITLYMRAEVDDEYKEFLDYMTLKIYKSNNKNTKKILIAQNKASEPGKLVSDIKLSTLKPGEICYITVELNVDKKMDNSQKLKEGIIRWIFSCDEELIKEEATTSSQGNKNNPFTGNGLPKMTIVAASGIVISILIIFLITRRKKDDDKDDSDILPH